MTLSGWGAVPPSGGGGTFLEGIFFFRGGEGGQGGENLKRSDFDHSNFFQS